jgi:flagellar basal-body rod modification protein FlgD
MHLTNAVSMIPRDSTATAGSTNPSQSSTTTANGELSESSFMTLLAVELQNQDPTAPMDPTEFVSQLAELNELQSTMQIQQSVNQIASALTSSQSSGTSSQTSSAASTS